MMKRVLVVLLVVALAATMFSACASTVNKPCAYCGSCPSKEYKRSDGSPFYVCKDCSSVCMLCNRQKATKHYESLLGVVFVCEDCYNVVTR